MKSFRGPDATERDYFGVSCFTVMLMTFGLGLYFRLKGLGEAPFAIDEYYIATSVKNILEHGLPQFDCGGLYVRGLLLQYVAAPFFKYGSHDEFYLRLITVLCNAATVPGLYLLAKQISGRTVACVVGILFCLSIWETEFARFGRMYAPFQAIFVWYVVFFYKAVSFGDPVAKRWMYALSFLCIFVYEGAIFLVLLNFLPFLIKAKETTTRDFVLSLVILICAYSYITYDFRHLGVESFLPTDLPEQPAGTRNLPFQMPVLLLSTLPFNVLWMLLFLGLLTLSGVVVWSLLARQRSNEKRTIPLPQAVLLVVFILLSLLNLYGFLICLIVLSLLLNWHSLSDIRTRSFALVGMVIGLTFIFWSAYGLFTNDWYALLETRRHSQIRELFVVFLKFPDTYTKIILTWFGAMPFFTIVGAALILSGIAESLVRPYDERREYLLLVAILLGLSVLLAVLKQPYTTIRYTFFLYPLVLLAIVDTLKRFVQWTVPFEKAHRAALIGFVIAFVVLAEDFGIMHLWNIDSDRALYRIDYDRFKRDQYYRRWDYRTPAKIINDNLEPGDIVISTANVSSYYLRQLDYFYLSYRRKRFKGISGCNGKKDIWTNANLIYEPGQLLNLVPNAQSTIWLIVRSPRYQARMQVEKEIAANFTRYWLFQSVDGNLDVYKILPSES